MYRNCFTQNDEYKAKINTLRPLSDEALAQVKACRSCSTFFIEHDNKFSAAFVVLEDNCPTRPTS